jgi:G:T/U-mismatch repair DNA glycosylase
MRQKSNRSPLARNCISLSAFWWIAGDCLGFRRDAGVSPSSGQPYALAKSLRYENVLPYEEQMNLLLANGFCLWDVVHSCERKGSLDQNIRNEVVNPIREFCDEHPTIRRIVLANGSTTATLFKKYFKDWLISGVFQAGEDEFSQRAFGKLVRREPLLLEAEPRITIISAISVSPAAAKFTYEQKRDFWEVNVYQPGSTDRG